MYMEFGKESRNGMGLCLGFGVRTLNPVGWRSNFEFEAEKAQIEVGVLSIPHRSFVSWSYLSGFRRRQPELAFALLHLRICFYLGVVSWKVCSTRL